MAGIDNSHGNQCDHNAMPVHKHANRRLRMVSPVLDQRLRRNRSGLESFNASMEAVYSWALSSVGFYLVAGDRERFDYLPVPESAYYTGDDGNAVSDRDDRHSDQARNLVSDDGCPLWIGKTDLRDEAESHSREMRLYSNREKMRRLKSIIKTTRR